jgi:large subunit ribosomal protein L28
VECAELLSRWNGFDHGWRLVFNPKGFMTTLVILLQGGSASGPGTPRLTDKRQPATDNECEASAGPLDKQSGPFQIRLTVPATDGSLRPFQARLMSKVCSITGSKPARGSVIHRRGMAKKKGGVGRHVTKNVPRIFGPNLHEHRIWVPELKKFVRVKTTARGLKTINKNGAHAALKKAGLI